jgi:hypothetical protein
MICRTEYPETAYCKYRLHYAPTTDEVTVWINVDGTEFSVAAPRASLMILVNNQSEATQKCRERSWFSFNAVVDKRASDNLFPTTEIQLVSTNKKSVPLAAGALLTPDSAPSTRTDELKFTARFADRVTVFFLPAAEVEMWLLANAAIAGDALHELLDDNFFKGLLQLK